MIVGLFTKLFGGDFLNYIYTSDHGTIIAERSDPRKSFTYDHGKWEASYKAMCQEKSTKLLSSAALLKQLADGTNPKAQAKPTALDGITPLDVDATTAEPGSPPMASDWINKPAPTKPQAASSATQKQPSVAKVLPGKLLLPPQPVQPFVAKLHSLKLMSPTQQLSGNEVLTAMKQQQDRAACQLHVQHGIPLNKLV